MSLLSAPEPKKSDYKSVAEFCPKSEGQPIRESKIGRFVNNFLRKTLFRHLEKLQEGQITFIEGDRQHTSGRLSPGTSKVELHIRDSRFYRYVALGGSLGAAEAYLCGYWECDNLVELIRLLCRDITVTRGLEGSLTRLTLPLRKLTHRLRKNTLGGSRRNIAAHYDLGEDFYNLFLDETMAYSCGIFQTPESTLYEASLAKFARACQKLQLDANDHVVEIGTGWGGFAIYATENYGCRVTTTTISQKQYEFSLQRVQDAGLEDRITVLCKDYRELEGTYDKLVSIEMIEAVGEEYFDTFFRTCSELLKPDGIMLLQAITISDQRFDRYRHSVDFIKQYVFPGGCLPSLGTMCSSLGRATDMRCVHLEDLTESYAETLLHWRKRFFANIDKVRELGFPEEFLRLWEYYLCYCEAGFRENHIGDIQLVLCKPKRHSLTTWNE